MRLSGILFQSLRETPADAASATDGLLVRAGLLRRRDGTRTWLPLGAMALGRAEALLQRELDRLGYRAVVLDMPAVAGEDVPDAGCAGRDELPDEATIAAVVASAVRSYRQLPARLRSTRAIRRASSREPLLPTTERMAIDLGVACADTDRLAEELGRVGSVLSGVIDALGVPTVVADWGPHNTDARALVLPHPAGDAVVLGCPSCGYAAEREIAHVARPAPEPEPTLPLEMVETPGTTTIVALATFLGIGPERCAKAAFFEADDGRLVTAIVRGDQEVSERKLAATVRADCLRPATADRIRASGMEPGYGSPVGARNTTVVVDATCAASPNLVAGANRPGWHLRNVNPGRDYAADLVVDIARAGAGEPCGRCGTPLAADRAMPLATLGLLLPRRPPSYLAPDGSSRDAALGGIRIEVERVLAASVELHRDDRGIIWAPPLAPLPVHVITIGADRDPAVTEVAVGLERAACASGSDVLWDDRAESPGVKFADADLIGLPVRLTVSSRSLASGGIELAVRGRTERRTVSVEEAMRIAGRPAGATPGQIGPFG